MSTKANQRRDVERNHTAILTAAIPVLLNSPQATMADIALASGTGRSTLYRHFPDREALITAIYHRTLAEAEVIAGHCLSGEHEDPIEALTSFCSALAALGDRYRFLEHHQQELDLKRPGGSRHNIKVALTDYLTVNQQRGGIRSDLPASWLKAMLATVITEAGKSHSESERPAVIVATVKSLLTAPSS